MTNLIYRTEGLFVLWFQVRKTPWCAAEAWHSYSYRKLNACVLTHKQREKTGDGPSF